MVLRLVDGWVVDSLIVGRQVNAFPLGNGTFFPDLPKHTFSRPAEMPLLRERLYTQERKKERKTCSSSGEKRKQFLNERACH